MEASRALAIVLRELESPALAEARAKLAQVESEAATRIAAAEARVAEAQDDVEVHALMARNARSGAEAWMCWKTKRHDSLVEDLYLSIQSLKEERDMLRERLAALTQEQKGLVRKSALKNARRHALKESTRIPASDAHTHGGVSCTVRSIKGVRRTGAKGSQTEASRSPSNH